MNCFETFVTNNYEELKSYAIHSVGNTRGYASANLYATDLLHDIVIVFLAKGEAIDSLCQRKEIRQYMKRSIKLAAMYKHGIYNKKYGTYESLKTNYDIENIQQEDEEWISYEKKQLGTVYAILQKMRWFDREVFKAYYLHSHTLDTFSNATGINRQTIYRSIRKAKAKIQEEAAKV